MSDRSLAVTLRTPAGGRRRIAIRIARDGGLVREETDLRRHYEVLSALQESDVPVPRTLFYEPEASILGGPFFGMEWVAGHVPIPWSPDGRAWLETVGRTSVADQFVRILAAIHRHRWEGVLEDILTLHGAGTAYARARVAEVKNLLVRYRLEPEPILVDAVEWLEHNLPRSTCTALVHGDYRTGNLVYRRRKIVAVLDWEFASLGDPMADVAWVCCMSNRMGSDKVCYLMPRQEFYDRYNAVSPNAVDETAVHFWEVFHQLRHVLIWASGAAAYRDGRTDDLRLLRMSYALPTMRRMVADLLGYP